MRTDVANTILPGSSFRLTMETDESTKVSLSAVDTAVYLLNSKNKLTPGKVRIGQSACLGVYLCKARPGHTGSSGLLFITW